MCPDPNPESSQHLHPEQCGAPPTDPTAVTVVPAPATERAPLDQPVRNHEDVLSLIGDVERQLERLRSAQARSAEELAQFADRGRRLDEREREIEVAASRLADRCDEVERRERRIVERTDEFELREQALREREGAIAERVASLADRDNALSEREAEVEGKSSALAAERDAVAAIRDQMRQENERADSERESLRVEITSVNERLLTLSRRCEELELEREGLAAERDAVRAERDGLLDRGSAHAEALAAAERNEAQLMLTIARLRELNEDSEASLQSRDQVVEAKDKAIGERDARISDLEREVEMNRQSLRTAGEKLASLAKSVADQAPQLERGAAALGLLNEQRQRLQAAEERVAELERELATAHEALEAARSVEPQRIVERVVETVVDNGALDAARAEIDRLREEIGEAERAVAQARSEAASSAGSQAERAVAATQEKLRGALEFLSTRKRRIDLARRLMRERKVAREAEVREASENAMIRVLEEERVVKRQREELRQVQELLATSERDMVSRYARHRGGLVAAWIMIVVSALAGGAWFAAPMVMPGASIASVDITAKTKDGEPITPEADNLFQTIHRDALADPALRTAVKKRLSERGVNALRGEAELDAWFAGVRVDSDGLGTLRLVAEGPDATSATIALDTLATTLVNESPKLTKGKNEAPRASIAGNSQVPGRLTFSTLVPQDGPWDRVVAGSLLFSGVATLGLVAGVVVFGRIARTKRRFEDAERFGATL